LIPIGWLPRPRRRRQNWTISGVKVQLQKAPWYPEHPEGFSARWILLHVIEEVARTRVHADIIREHIDGATIFQLMAAAEGWPETDWLKP
jgi:Protein of unknown function (DUF664)